MIRELIIINVATLQSGGIESCFFTCVGRRTELWLQVRKMLIIIIAIGKRIQLQVGARLLPFRLIYISDPNPRRS